MLHSVPAPDLTIRAGEWDTQTVNEPLRHQDKQVSIVMTHPDYKSGILHNDYALLILTEPVELADNVEVVCLPEEYDVVNSNCFATGWGKNQFGMLQIIEFCAYFYRNRFIELFSRDSQASKDTIKLFLKQLSFLRFHTIDARTIFVTPDLEGTLNWTNRSCALVASTVLILVR